MLYVFLVILAYTTTCISSQSHSKNQLTTLIENGEFFLNVSEPMPEKVSPGSSSVHEDSYYGLSSQAYNILIHGDSVRTLRDFMGEFPLHVILQPFTRKRIFKKISNSQAINLVRLCLDCGINVNERDSSKETPLHVACSGSYFEACDLLIKKGANIHAKDTLGYTPLHNLVSGELHPVDPTCSVKLSDLIQVFRKDINVACPDGLTPLHMSARDGNLLAVDELLNLGADYDALDELQFTPLHIACRNGKLAVAHTLIQKGCNIHRVDYNDNTVLHHLAECSVDDTDDKSIIELLKYLVDFFKGDVQSVNKDGDTPLHLAAQHSSTLMIKLLLAIGAKVNAQPNSSAQMIKLLLAIGAKFNAQPRSLHGSFGSSPLHVACSYGKFDVAIVLIENGANTLSRGHYERSPLHSLSEQNNYSLSSMKSEDLATLTRLLLLLKGALEMNDSAGDTPLHITVHRLQYERFLGPATDPYIFIRLLVDAGAHLEALNADGETPLLAACEDHNENLMVFLVELGAKRNAQDHKGNTALHKLARQCAANRSRPKNGRAASMGRLMSYFIGEVHTKNFDGRTPLYYHCCEYKDDLECSSACTILIENGSDVNAEDNTGMTPLHAAVKSADLKCSKILVKNGAMVSKKDRCGNTPLHFVCFGSDFVASSSDLSYDQEKIARLLFAHKAKINEVNSEGDTPLHNAARTRNTRIVNFLLDNGADRNISNALWQTALHCACLKEPRNTSDLHTSNFDPKDKKTVQKLLLPSLGKAHAQDIFGNEPSHYWVSSFNEGFDVFKKLCTSIQTKNKSGWSHIHLACLHKNHAILIRLLEMASYDIHADTTPSGKTCLMIACEQGDEIGFDMLLSHGTVRPEIRDNTLGNALDWACEFGHMAMCKKLVDNGFALPNESHVNKLKLLVSSCNQSDEMRALIITLWDWSVPDTRGNTVMHYACQKGEVEAVQALIVCSGVPQSSRERNLKGKTARKLAQNNNHTEIVTILSQYNVNE